MMIISFLRRGPFLSVFSSAFILVRLNHITIIRRRRTQRPLHQRNNRMRNKEISEHNNSSNMSGSKRKYALFLSRWKRIVRFVCSAFFIKFRFILFIDERCTTIFSSAYFKGLRTRLYNSLHIDHNALNGIFIRFSFRP